MLLCFLNFKIKKSSENEICKYNKVIFVKLKEITSEKKIINNFEKSIYWIKKQKQNIFIKVIMKQTHSFA